MRVIPNPQIALPAAAERARGVGLRLETQHRFLDPFRRWKSRGLPGLRGLRQLRGLTLVEVLAVVVILGLIAGTLLIGFSGAFGQAKHELGKSGIGVIVSKVEAYRIQHGHWPSNELSLLALTDGYALPTAPYYLSPDQLIDPWGNPYLYVTPGPDGHPYEIITYGADGQPGGEPGTENAEISSVNLRGSKK